MNKNLKCALCNSQGRYIYKDLPDNIFRTSGKWSLIECTGCGLVWIDPMPDLNDISKFYEKYYTHDHAVDRRDIREFVKRVILATSKRGLGYKSQGDTVTRNFLSRLFYYVGPFREAAYRTVMWLHAEQKGKLLDIGCGSGFFLNYMKELGWDVYGIEPDQKAADYAKSVLKLKNIYSENLEEADFEERDFDAITMSHVIEHLVEPVKILNRCFGLLKPGGSLVITSPNTAALGRKRFKENWRGWEPPRHVFLYNIKSLSLLLSKAGFTIKTAKTPASSTFPMWLESLSIRKNISGSNFYKKITIAMKIEAFFFWGLEYLLARFGVKCSEELLIIAKRPGLEGHR